MDIVIPARFNGPPSSANGGYACGAVAELLDGPATVQLRAPPPLGVPLAVERDADSVRIVHGGQLVAVARAGGPPLEAPSPPSRGEAEEAVGRYIGWHGHPFPTCFVCGPERAPGDGLRVFPGPVGATVAAPWTPDASVCEAGVVVPRVVWAALDCPSYFGAAAAENRRPFALLAELAATVAHRPREGERCVAIGWSGGRDGRKLRAGSAIWSEERGLLAVGAAMWIEPKAGGPPVG